MTWAPKVGEWVWVVDTGKVGEVITVWNGLPAHPQWIRPATIDEIPGNTATEEEHDRALCEAMGLGEVRDLAVSLALLDGLGLIR